MQKLSHDEYNRTKIYRKLSPLSKPPGYDETIPWIIQCQIAATNGKQYNGVVGKLKKFPFYELPLPSVTGNKLMLDIGAGWGRWLYAGAAKGYLPIGLDMRIEFAEAQQKIFQQKNIKGYSIVADLEFMPFQDNVFDLVWSFGVLQHAHSKKMIRCLSAINDILQNECFTYLQFPNKNGIHNRYGPVQREEVKRYNMNSWGVRYYSIDEYKKIIATHFKDTHFDVHSFLGIGVLKEDLKYVTWKRKIACLGSLFLTQCTRALPSLINYADSIYIKAYKKHTGDANPNIESFLYNHHHLEFDNLNIIHLLKCPKSGNSLELTEDRKRLISKEAGIYYPVINNIPMLIPAEAISL